MCASQYNSLSLQGEGTRAYLKVTMLVEELSFGLGGAGGAEVGTDESIIPDGRPDHDPIRFLDFQH